MRSVLSMTLLLFVMLLGCSPTVQVAAEKPIEINLNIKIQHEIKIKLDKGLDEMFSDDSDLF